MKTLKRDMLTDAAARTDYDAIADEYAIARELIAVRRGRWRHSNKMASILAKASSMMYCGTVSLRRTFRDRQSSDFN